MKVKVICNFEENELNALKTIASVDCVQVTCEECPLNVTEHKKCVRAIVRAVLDKQNIDY